MAGETVSANGQQHYRSLAVRDELSAKWHPATGLDCHPIDKLAQTETFREHWLKRMLLLDALEKADDESSGPQSPPVAMATAIEQAANMVDRFHRIYMRTLRQLSDLLRYSHQVTV